ncbi:hypothetical protein FCV25MIE_21914 [Fagus crenata]
MYIRKPKNNNEKPMNNVYKLHARILRPGFTMILCFSNSSFNCASPLPLKAYPTLAPSSPTFPLQTPLPTTPSSEPMPISLLPTPFPSSLGCATMMSHPTTSPSHLFSRPTLASS